MRDFAAVAVVCETATNDSLCYIHANQCQVPARHHSCHSLFSNCVVEYVVTIRVWQNRRIRKDGAGTRYDVKVGSYDAALTCKV